MAARVGPIAEATLKDGVDVIGPDREVQRDGVLAIPEPPERFEAIDVRLGRPVRRSYKSDDRVKQTPERLIARKDLLEALEQGRSRLGLRIRLKGPHPTSGHRDDLRDAYIDGIAEDGRPETAEERSLRVEIFGKGPAAGGDGRP